MARRLHKTLVDYLVIAISPAMIMAMVGSLVFFLIEVFYQGNYHGRLQYIVALFVVGAVLIGRISIEDGRERAALFAVPLGIAALMAIQKFVEFQGEMLGRVSFLINCALLGIVWWSADKLTWDCTLIDESEEDSGEGLLESAGLERSGKASQALLQAEGQVSDETPIASAGPEVTQSFWRSRWERFAERRRRPHAPGVWVIYFSLAALPLFGIGQMFVSSGDSSTRQYAFQLLVVYTASGLGLLMTTSFLGLRRYLRQRGEEMPIGMISLWLTIGSVLLVGVMIAAMLVPRPNAEYAVSELPFRVGSPDQTSSRHGMGRDGVDDKQPWARSEKRGDVPDESAAQAKSGDMSGDKPGSDSAQSEKEKGATAAPDGEKTRQASSGERSETKGDASKATDEKARQSSPNERSEAKGDASQPSKQQAESKRADEASETKGGMEGDRPPIAGQTPSRPPPHAFQPLHVPMDAGTLLVDLAKWMLYGVLGLIAALWAWKNKDGILAAIANIGPWLADLWNRLFGGTRQQDAGDDGQAESPRVPLRRFADFTDPFASGAADQQPAEELVRYTFDALEAWGRDQGHARASEQTPHEFVRELGVQAPWLSEDAVRLADLYCQVAYAHQTLRRSKLGCLQRCWRGMTQAETQPTA